MLENKYRGTKGLAKTLRFEMEKSKAYKASPPAEDRGCNGDQSKPYRMKIQGGAHSPARFPPNGPTSSSGLNLNVTADARLRRRKTRRPGSAGAGFRLRRSGTPEGRGSVLTTPLLRWKFDDDEFGVGAGGESVAGRRGVRRVRSGGEVDVSARRLAAGLWHLSLAAESSGGGGGGRGGGKGGDLQCASYDRLGLEVSLA